MFVVLTSATSLVVELMAAEFPISPATLRVIRVFRVVRVTKALKVGRKAPRPNCHRHGRQFCPAIHFVRAASETELIMTSSIYRKRHCQYCRMQDSQTFHKRITSLVSVLGSRILDCCGGNMHVKHPIPTENSG